MKSYKFTKVVYILNLYIILFIQTCKYLHQWLHSRITEHVLAFITIVTNRRKRIIWALTHSPLAPRFWQNIPVLKVAVTCLMVARKQGGRKITFLWPLCLFPFNPSRSPACWIQPDTSRLFLTPLVTHFWEHPHRHKPWVLLISYLFFSIHPSGNKD